MSDSVRDLLTRGIAAARFGDKKEARFFLEWVLRHPETAQEQRLQALLWLSEVSDDPDERRSYLQEVLAINPADPLARRGMAILEGRLRPEDIVDHRKPVEPAPPAATVTPGAVRRYTCPKCGGQMAYAPDPRAVQCERCGHRMWEFDAIQQGLFAQELAEQDFVATLPTARAHRWELAAVRTLTCQGCGANVTLPPARVTAACPFCDSAHVVVGQETRELIQPDGVLPFEVNAGQALQLVRDWLKEQRSRPDDLDKRALIDDPAGVYVPYWTFDISGEVNCAVDTFSEVSEPSDAFNTAMSGRYDLDIGRRNSSILVSHDDMLVPASRSVPGELLDGLPPFDTTGLVAYTPELLSDWPAEIYQIPLADASIVAHQKALEQATEELQRETGLILTGVLHTSCSGQGIMIESYKLVLLPVWLGGYRYEGERYRVAINGQTGKVTGRVPHSGVRRLIDWAMG